MAVALEVATWAAADTVVAARAVVARAVVVPAAAVRVGV